MARPRKIDALFAQARTAQPTLADWMRANHTALLAQLGAGRIKWRTAMAVITDLGLTDEHGQTPSRDTVARTWTRVRREIAETQRASTLPSLQPGEIAPGVRLSSPFTDSHFGARPSQPPFESRFARPRYEVSSHAAQAPVPAGSSASEAQARPPGTPAAQPHDGATEQIMRALGSMASSRVPMPKPLL